MNKPVAVGLVGIGGYGHEHLSALRTLQGAGICRLLAVADPFASHRAVDVAALKAEGVGIYESAEELCAREDMEAVFIATPIPLHVCQTLLALNAGKNVYLEKIPCATLGELAQLENAENASGKICTVGFQLQTSPAIKIRQKANLRLAACKPFTPAFAGVATMRIMRELGRAMAIANR